MTKQPITTSAQTKIINGQEFTRIRYTNHGAHAPVECWYPTENLPSVKSDYEIVTTNAAREAGRKFILTLHGQPVTRINRQSDGSADVHTGKREDAIEYTEAEAGEVVAWIGSGAEAEPTNASAATTAQHIPEIRLPEYHLIPSIGHPVTCRVCGETKDLSNGQIVHVISEDGGTAVVATHKRPSLSELVEISAGLLIVENN